MVKKKSENIRNQALEIFRKNGCVLTSTEATRLGIHPRILYELRDSGQIKQLSRGLFGLPNLPGLEQPDLAAVAKRIPDGVVCLTSALYLYELTVQIPRWVDIAVHGKYHPPHLAHPPVQFHWFSDAVLKSGVETKKFGGVLVKIYSEPKTIVDCFRLRSKVGLDVALEALKNYWKSGKADMDLLYRFAKEGHMLRFMKPYIESVMHDQS